MSAPPVYSSRLPTKRKFGCFSCLFWALIFVFGIGALLLTQTSYFTEQGIKEGIALIKRKVSELTHGFISHDTEESGEAIVRSLGRTHGDVVEVASPTVIQEEFSKSDTKYAAWGWVNMGTTVTELKVPAYYRFHIKLSEIQQVEVKDGVMRVVIPRIIPTVPVAFDTQKVERKSSSGWLRFDEQDQLKTLEQNITPALEARAANKLNLIKENARKDIQAFFERMLSNDSSGTSQIQKVEVFFEDEDLSNSPVMSEGSNT